MKLKLEDNLNFSKLSKDRNKIHIDEKFAKKLLYKKNNLSRSKFSFKND